MLVGLLVQRLAGRRSALEKAARGFLRNRSHGYLAQVVGDRRFALAVAAALVASVAAPALPPVALSDVAVGTGGFIMSGIDENDASGFSVCGAGDVNGDGFDDLIVGAYFADVGGYSLAGESYVVFGKADGAPVKLLNVVLGVGGFVISGADAFDYSGRSVSGAGDVNGDGLADLIIGAPYAYAADRAYTGETYVVFGKTGTAAVDLVDVADGAGGFAINGIDAGDYAGISVSSAGDVNGDGLADLIIGASNADPGGRDAAGESYVVFGKADGTAVSLADVAAGTGGFVINGIDPGDRSGLSVSGAGDVNGDGLADVIIGARHADPGGNDGAGESYVVFGKADTVAVDRADVAAGIGGFVINGIDPSDSSGASVSGAGDVNGDGLADLIVGANFADPDGNDIAGESYVVFGKTDTAAVSLADVAAGTGGFVIKGIEPGDRSGSTVSGAGDIDDDGLDDVIVGARFAGRDPNEPEGESYVVFGKMDTVPVDLACVADGAGGFVIRGIDSGDRSGVSVAGAGDVNGDGRADLIVGASFADTGGNSLAGESYVVFGPTCVWDCGSDDGTVGTVDINDFLALLADWGGPSPCDFDGGGVGTTDMLQMLANWGPCPK